MEPTIPLEELEPIELQMEEMMTQCIGILLGVIAMRVQCGEEDSEACLGEIRIMKDPNGQVGERIAQRGDNDTFATYFACVPTEEVAYELEYQLMQLAIDPKLLESAIISIQPGYRRSVFAEDLRDAVDRISEVFSMATVIPSGSPINMMLNQSVMRSC